MALVALVWVEGLVALVLVLALVLGVGVGVPIPFRGMTTITTHAGVLGVGAVILCQITTAPTAHVVPIEEAFPNPKVGFAVVTLLSLLEGVVVMVIPCQGTTTTTTGVCS